MLAVISFLRFSGVLADVLRLCPRVLDARVGLLALALCAATACEGKYNLAPTFCDDWCLATSKCGAQPANCVSNCELTRASGSCAERQQHLLECYQDADKEDFACLDTGFQMSTRVRAGTCEPERDALFECEAPGMGLCLLACRDAQAKLLGETTDSDVQVQNAQSVARELPDGGVVTCPALEEPCEAQCWTLFAFTSAGLVAAGADPEASGPDLPAAAGAAVVGCGQQALLSCYPLTDGGEPPSLLESIQQCVAEQGVSGPRPGQRSDAGAAAGSDEPARPVDAGTPGAQLSPAFERVGCDVRAALNACGSATCHYDNSSQLGSDLAMVNRETRELMHDLEQRLVNVPASYHNVSNPSACPAEPELLINPADVEQSLLIKKLAGMQTCGAEMPKFPDAEWGATNNPGERRGEFVDCIREWVALLAEDYSMTQ